MRIALTTAVYYPMINGVAVFSHNLAKGLAARGHEVVVLCPSQNGRSHAEMQDGVRVEYLRSKEFKFYPDQIHAAKKNIRKLGKISVPMGYKHGFRVAVPARREVAQLLERFRPEVVHVQVADLIGMAATRWVRKNDVPLVMTEHNQPEVLVEPLKMPKLLKKPVVKLLNGFFVKRMNRGDFATMPTEEAIKKLILAEGKEFKAPIAAVSNGVELSNFKPGEVSRGIYQKYRIQQGLPTVLYVGRVDPEKQVGLVLEAFRLAREAALTRADKKGVKKKTAKIEGGKGEKNGEETARDMQLLVVGDGVARAELEEKALKMGLEGSVRFMGRVVPPDLYELYRVGTVFATASEIETQGIVLIEAAATGLPLIAVDRGAVGAVCRDGENGILCQPGDVDGLAVAMINILTDKKMREKFSKKSLEIARENDFERTLDQFLNIYRKVVELKKEK